MLRRNLVKLAYRKCTSNAVIMSWQRLQQPLDAILVNRLSPDPEEHWRLQIAHDLPLPGRQRRLTSPSFP